MLRTLSLSLSLSLNIHTESGQRARHNHGSLRSKNHNHNAPHSVAWAPAEMKQQLFLGWWAPARMTWVCRLIGHYTEREPPGLQLTLLLHGDQVSQSPSVPGHYGHTSRRPELNSELNFQPSPLFSVRRHNWNNLIIRISTNLYPGTDSNDEKYQASDWLPWRQPGLSLADPEQSSPLVRVIEGLLDYVWSLWWIIGSGLLSR